MISKKQLRIALVVLLVVSGSAISYWSVNVRGTFDESLLSKPVLVSDSGDSVINANKTSSLRGYATLDPTLVVDKKKIGMVAQVEYYFNDKLIQTLVQAPFYLNTKLVSNGTYTIRSSVRFNDESIQEQSLYTHIENPAEAPDQGTVDPKAHSNH